jgi:hypothetical protein
MVVFGPLASSAVMRDKFAAGVESPRATVARAADRGGLRLFFGLDLLLLGRLGVITREGRRRLGADLPSLSTFETSGSAVVIVRQLCEKRAIFLKGYRLGQEAQLPCVCAKTVRLRHRVPPRPEYGGRDPTR